MGLAPVVVVAAIGFLALVWLVVNYNRFVRTMQHIRDDPRYVQQLAIQ